MKVIAKIWDWCEETCIVLLLAFMTIVNFVNVVGRYFFNRSFSSAEELVITSFVYISMFGIAVAYKRGAHLGMGLITENVSPKIRAWMILFSVLCSMILISLIFYLSFDMIGGQIRSGERTSATGLPAYYQRISIPLGCLLIAMRTIQWGVFAFKKDFYGKARGE
jgi:C4-dicarboxylate transporter DctQ subunit